MSTARDEQEARSQAFHGLLASFLGGSAPLAGGMLGARLNRGAFDGPWIPLQSGKDFSAQQMARHTGLDVKFNQRPGLQSNAYFMPRWAARSAGKPHGRHGLVGRVYGPKELFQHGFDRPGMPADVAAHELGHAQSMYGKVGRLPKWVSYGRIAGTPLAGAGAFTPWLVNLLAGAPDKQDQLLNWGSGLAAAGMVPVLADEAMASRNALRIMRSLPAGTLAEEVLKRAPGRLARAWGTYGLGAAGMVLGPQVAKWYLQRHRDG